MARERERKNDISFDLSLSDEQRAAKTEMLRHPINIILGQAGSGKTLLSCNVALDSFFLGKVDQVIITRSTVTAEGNGIGYLPGGIDEKMDPLMQGIYQNFFKLYGSTDAKRAKIKRHVESGEIKIIPIAYTRSITYDNAVIIVDEMQNLTLSQLELVLGRLGKTSRLIFTGSADQIDLPRKEQSAIHIVDRFIGNKYVYVKELTSNHRHEALEEVLPIVQAARK
jgi:phosphate starvation-inducible protein PhoH and related proteins